MSSTDSSPRSAGPLPVGISDFGKLIRGNHTFIDKSPLIRDLIREGAEVTLLTRPRRFGKTLNLSMLHHFFAGEVSGQSTEGLFEGLEISKDAASMAHQGQYPVIFFTCKDIKEDRFDDAVSKLHAALGELYQDYPELVDSPHLAEEQRAKVAAIRAEKASLTDLGKPYVFYLPFVDNATLPGGQNDEQGRKLNFMLSINSTILAFIQRFKPVNHIFLFF